MFRVSLFLLAFSLSFQVKADLSTDLKSFVSSKLKGVLPEDIHTKLFGSLDDKITLPKIPKVNRNSKDINFYRREKKTKNVKWPKNKAEFDLNYVKEIYLVTRQLQVSNDDLVKWMNVLTQGSSREGVYRGIVNDLTYRSLEKLAFPCSDSLIEFVSYYLEKYLNEKPSKDILLQMNFYQIKRIVTERTLDLFDYFSEQEDFFKWYAVFSADLAMKQPSIWENKIRADKGKYFHYNWAKTVNSEFIVSEFLIKIHKALNQYKIQ